MAYINPKTLKEVNTLREEHFTDSEALDSIIEGIESAPEGIRNGLTRIYNTIGIVAFYNPQEYLETWDENIRGVKVIGTAIKTVHSYRGPIKEAIEIIFHIYFSYLPQCAQETIAKKLGLQGLYYAGRASANYVIKIIAQKTAPIIMRHILRSAVFQKMSQRITAGMFFASTKVGAVLTFATYVSILEDAGQASRRLREKYPHAYNELRRHNLDMVYFLIEDTMDKFLQGILRARVQKSLFEKTADQVFCSKTGRGMVTTTLSYTAAHRSMLELAKYIERR